MRYNERVVGIEDSTEYHKRNIGPRLGFVLLGFYLLAFGHVFLFPSTLSSAIGAANAEVGVSVKEFIKLAVDTNALALKDSNNNTVISPSSSGTLITGDVNVAVTTNTTKGYTLSLYTNDSTTGMTHSNTNVSTKIDSISTVSGYDASTGLGDLSANTWGFRKYINGSYSNWFGVGSSLNNGIVIADIESDDADFCEELVYPIPASCPSGSYDTYKIGFGAKLTSALPAGTYTNRVVFSATAKSEGTRYIVNFLPNGGEGAMSSKTTLGGSTFVFPEGIFTKNGYKVVGWALTSGATTVAYKTGASVAVNDLITAATAAGQNVPSNNSLNLYAVWAEKLPCEENGSCMQGFSCNKLTSVGQVVTLVDTRDGKEYRVKKLSDNKCWMIDNLAIGSNGIIELDSSNTHLPNGVTYYLPANGYMNSPSASTSDGAVAADFANDSATNRYFKVAVRNVGDAGDKNSAGTLAQQTGYYDFYTATMGFAYYASVSAGSSLNKDICPKGWRLPVISSSATTAAGTRDFTGDFAALANAYNPSATWSPADLTESVSTSDADVLTGMITGNPLDTTHGYLGLIYTGYYNGTFLNNVGSYSYYWTSSIRNASYGYYLLSSSTVFYPQSANYKYYGYSIRCISS